MRRALAASLTLQTATLSDNGLERARVWAGGTATTVQLMPASRSDVELAGLRGERVTHTAIVPYGVTVTTDLHRFLDGTTVYRVASVAATPKNLVCVLEATS